MASAEHSATSTDRSVAEVLAAEQQRCRSIGEQDRAALEEVLEEDLSYLHSTGLLEGKADYVDTSIGGTPRTVEREDLRVRIYGDTAVLTGRYIIRIEPDAESAEGRYLDAEGLQVWVKREGRWRLAAHQGTDRATYVDAGNKSSPR